MTYILGLSAFYHDSAACLVVDGEIVAAAQEERFTRVKHDPGFPSNAVRYCLKEAGITLDQLHYVGFYDKPLLKFDRLLETYLDYTPSGFFSFLKSMPLWMKEKLWAPDAFLGLAICEIGLRLLGYKYGGSTWTFDPLVGVSLRPGASALEVDEGVAWTKINSHGYRDRDRALSKPRGVYRVAALDDSYTEARQVDMDKTFTSPAEEELNRRRCRGERQAEVLNFGIGGATPPRSFCCCANGCGNTIPM